MTALTGYTVTVGRIAGNLIGRPWRICVSDKSVRLTMDFTLPGTSVNQEVGMVISSYGLTVPKTPPRWPASSCNFRTTTFPSCKSDPLLVSERNQPTSAILPATRPPPVRVPRFLLRVAPVADPRRPTSPGADGRWWQSGARRRWGLALYQGEFGFGELQFSGDGSGVDESETTKSPTRSSTTFSEDFRFGQCRRSQLWFIAVRGERVGNAASRVRACHYRAVP